MTVAWSPHDVPHEVSPRLLSDYMFSYWTGTIWCDWKNTWLSLES